MAVQIILASYRQTACSMRGAISITSSAKIKVSLRRRMCLGKTEPAEHQLDCIVSTVPLQKAGRAG